MKRENVGKWMKKVTVGFLTAAMVLTGVMVFPKTAEAAENTVKYLDRTTEFEALKGTKTAPTEEGYLFGGWYSYDGSNYSSIAENKVDTYEGTAYAKFVPANVLSVMTQIDSTTKSAGEGHSNLASLRIMVGVDSLNYQAIGVKVLLGDVYDTKVDSKTKVYQRVAIDGTTLEASEIFGAPADYFAVWKFTGIDASHDKEKIYVQPYWVTMDGTKVYGLAKYVHIEDGYRGYISVPVNLMSGKQTAAGIVAMGYDSSKMTLIGVENGHVANDEMNYDSSTTDTTGTVKIVGNKEKVGAYADSGESLFANVRFMLNDSPYVTNPESGVMRRKDVFTFDIIDPDFSDWNENPVEVGAWTIRY